MATGIAERGEKRHIAVTGTLYRRVGVRTRNPWHAAAARRIAHIFRLRYAHCSTKHSKGNLVQMSIVELLVLLLIAGICGAAGKAIAGYFPGGFFASIGVGFVGALVGSWLARLIGLPELFAIRAGGVSFPIIWSIAGSALFVAIIALLSGRYYSRRYV